MCLVSQHMESKVRWPVPAWFHQLRRALTRYALNYKGLPYETVWIEYPDIEDHCKKIGAEPSMIRKNGKPYYSLPVIQHDGKVITDSARIVEYLDSTYPDTPKIIPAGTHVLHKAFFAAYDSATFSPLVRCHA